MSEKKPKTHDLKGKTSLLPDFADFGAF